MRAVLEDHGRERAHDYKGVRGQNPGGHGLLHDGQPPFVEDDVVLEDDELQRAGCVDPKKCLDRLVQPPGLLFAVDEAADPGDDVLRQPLYDQRNRDPEGAGEEGLPKGSWLVSQLLRSRRGGDLPAHETLHVLFITLLSYTRDFFRVVGTYLVGMMQRSFECGRPDHEPGQDEHQEQSEQKYIYDKKP